jgi:hypothetical protein
MKAGSLETALAVQGRRERLEFRLDEYNQGSRQRLHLVCSPMGLHR